MRILALDFGESCGYAYGDLDNLVSGTWNLKIGADESKGMQLVRLRANVNRLREDGIAVLVFERVAGQHRTDITRGAEKAGVVKELCESTGIPYKAFSAGEIKKYATGNGNAKKREMLGAAIHKFGTDCGQDHNRADALALWHLAYSEYGDGDGLPATPPPPKPKKPSKKKGAKA